MEFLGRIPGGFWGAGPGRAGPQKPAHARSGPERPPHLCSILVIQQHKAAKSLQGQNAPAFEALVENLQNQIWKRRCSYEMVQTTPNNKIHPSFHKVVCAWGGGRWGGSDFQPMICGLCRLLLLRQFKNNSNIKLFLRLLQLHWKHLRRLVGKILLNCL